MLQSNVDTVRLSLFKTRLEGITREMGAVMIRTAVSPIFSINHDFSCFISDAAGYTVAQADGLPVHTGAVGFITREIIRRFAEDINDGDIFLANDPYVAAGSHLPDWTVIRPVYLEGIRVAWVGNRAHMVDVGGNVPGAYNIEATEIYQEGIRIPPIRIASNGSLDETVIDLVTLNTRSPVAVRADLMAMLSALFVGHREIKAFVTPWNAAELGDYLSALLDYSEQAMIAAVRESFEPGVYTAEEIMNNDVHSDRSVPICVKAEIADGRIHFDFSGSSSQIKAFKNSPLANTCASVYIALAMLVDEHVPRNEGAYRVVSITAPEGSVVNPRPPAAVAYSTASPSHDIAHACLKVLGAAAPDLASAGWGKVTYPITIGYRKEQDEPYVIFHWNGAPGAGAVKERDGFEQMGPMNALGGLVLPNMESYEQLYPVRFGKLELRQDGGGPGKKRGGTGVEYIVDCLEGALWIFRGEGLRTPTGFGIVSGRPGRPGQTMYRDLEGKSDWIEPPQWSMVSLGPCRVRILSPGGGGWGNPFDRDPEAVADDVRKGYVSYDAAFDGYGVVLTDKLMVDYDATERQRRLLSIY